MEAFQKILEAVEESKNIVIAGHTSPDGDAIGACLALGMSIKNLGGNVKVLLENYIQPGIEKYDLIPGIELVTFDGYENIECDLFISADCGDKDRLGMAKDVFEKAVFKINIDHHSSNTNFADINIVKTDYSSTSEIMFEIIKGFSKIDEKIATALYAGLLFDTGGFRHSCTTSNTMKVASELLKFNIPSVQLYDAMYYTRTYSSMKILGCAINKAEQLYDGKVIYTVVTLDDIDNCKSSLKELDEIVNCLKSVKGTDLAIFFYEKAKDVFKVSLRSSDNFDSCALAKCFGGGGHIKASGCTVEGDIQCVKEKVFEKLDEMMI